MPGRVDGEELGVLHKVKTPLIYLSSLVIGCIAGGAIITLWPKLPPYAIHLGKEVPVEGLIENEHGLGSTPNPENGRQGLAKIYKAIVAYRAKNGALPPSMKVLASGSYGLTKADLENPDMMFADGGIKPGRHSAYESSFRATRPDGAKKPAFPAKGERDVWAVCPIYVRSNARVNRDTTSSVNMQGAYLVLWSDGKIESMKPDARLAYADSHGYHRAFKGQAGSPKTSTNLASLTGRIRSEL